MLPEILLLKKSCMVLDEKTTAITIWSVKGLVIVTAWGYSMEHISSWQASHIWVRKFPAFHKTRLEALPRSQEPSSLGVGVRQGQSLSFAPMPDVSLLISAFMIKLSSSWNLHFKLNVSWLKLTRRRDLLSKPPAFSVLWEADKIMSLSDFQLQKI
jgi:hypothetical protein